MTESREGGPALNQLRPVAEGGAALLANEAQNRTRLTVSEALLIDTEHVPKNVAFRQGAAEFVGSLAAGVGGTAAFSLLAKEAPVPLKIAAAAIVGGVTKFSVKGGMELGLLPAEYRLTSKKDLAWGMVDGLAGVAASATEQRAARKLTTDLGFKYAGTALSKESALVIGEKVLAGSIQERIKQNAMRGVAAGFTGSLLYSIPHAVANNSEKLSNQATFTEGLLATGKEIGLNTAVGTVFGGVLSGTISTLANSKEIFRYTKASLQGDKGVTRVDVLHFNDMHSALVGERASLPQLATRADELRAVSAEKGRKALLFDLGDNYSGNVIAGSTEVGYVETKAIQMMKPDGFIPGNHVADVGFGQTNVDAWAANMARITKEVGHDLPALAANIEVPAYPGLVSPKGTYKPYRIIEAANGEKVGVVGLVTRELETGSDKAVLYLDAKNAAEKAIAELNAGGVNKVIVLSHLGRAEDVHLAQSLKGKVGAIVGAHSHDVEPLPLWIRNTANGNDIPIVQAGSKAGWLGELNLAFKADGTADKFRTAGRLHEIHSGIKPHTGIRNFIESETGKIAAQTPGTYRVADLHADVYHDVHVSQPFSSGGIRGEDGIQTPLGTVISKALLTEVNENLPAINAARAGEGLAPLRPLSIILKHTGDIREEIPAGVMNRLTASNVFLNTGSATRETSEMAAIQLTGKQIDRVLEFSVHDLAPAAPIQPGTLPQRIGTRLKSLFVESKNMDLHDYTGNFIVTEGLRYNFNRALPPGQRVSGIQFYDQASKKFVNLEPDRVYDVLTLFHPVDKWGKLGMTTTYDTHPQFNLPENWVFGSRLGSKSARELVNAQPIPLSQVDLLVSYLRKNQGKLTPANFNSNAINDLTPTAWRPQIMVGRSGLPGMAAAAAFDTVQQK